MPTTLPGAEAARKVRKKTFAAGATVTLNGNGSTNSISSMYNVVVVPLVSDLVVASGEAYQWFDLASGQNMYIDRTYRFSSPIPASINGQFTLRTANDDKFSSANATHASFTVNQASTVDVLYTTVNTTLESTWLTDANGWSLEDYTVPTTLPGAEAARKVRKKTFAAGATVTLNGNGSTNNISSMYNVVVVP